MLQLAFALAIGVAAVPPSPEAGLPISLDLEVIRAIPVQHDGRWPPLDTLARDMVASVTGTISYRGYEPVAVLLGWTFKPETWATQPLISMDNEDLRRKLQLPVSRTAFSYEELVNHAPFMAMYRDPARMERGKKPDPLQSKVGDIGEQLIALQQIFKNDVIRFIPHPKEYGGAWRTIPLARDRAPPGDDSAAAAWAALMEAFNNEDAPAFTSASQRLAASLEALPAAHRPDSKLIATELRYNRLRPFRSAWMVMAAGAGLAALAMLVRRRWCDVLAVLGMIAGFGLLTYGLSLRWEIAGRIPAANMFESLLFLSWGMGAFAIVAVFVLRHRVVPLTASALGAAALLVADLLLPAADQFIRPIPPVLADTVWMSIHVPVIMVSYSVLALAVLIAHVQLVVMAAVPHRRQLAGAVDTLHYWYVLVGSLLLLAGILTGSMWAASSWGRYWGWDPKEVWSLVAFLGYMAILHARINRERVPTWAYALAGLLAAALFGLVVPQLGVITPLKLLALIGAGAAMVFFVLARGRFATAVKSILAFWLIIMTYVGVNFVLGIGLHSYGFGTGAVAHYMFWTGGVDLALVAVCGLIYAARRQLGPPPEIGLPVATPT